MTGQELDWHRHPNGGGIVWNEARVAASAYVGPEAKAEPSVDVPDGFEVVVLPSETVDEYAAGEFDGVSTRHVVEACRAARARRRPATERVPWWEAVGRTDSYNGLITSVTFVAGSKPQVYAGDWVTSPSPDGTVEVLVEGDR